MVGNFRTREINRDTHKLTQIPNKLYYQTKRAKKPLHDIKQLLVYIYNKKSRFKVLTMLTNDYTCFFFLQRMQVDIVTLLMSTLLFFPVSLRNYMRKTNVLRLLTSNTCRTLAMSATLRRPSPGAGIDFGVFVL